MHILFVLVAEDSEKAVTRDNKGKIFTGDANTDNSIASGVLGFGIGVGGVLLAQSLIEAQNPCHRRRRDTPQPRFIGGLGGGAGGGLFGGGHHKNCYPPPYHPPAYPPPAYPPPAYPPQYPPAYPPSSYGAPSYAPPPPSSYGAPSYTPPSYAPPSYAPPSYAPQYPSSGYGAPVRSSSKYEPPVSRSVGIESSYQDNSELKTRSIAGSSGISNESSGSGLVIGFRNSEPTPKSEVDNSSFRIANSRARDSDN